MNESEKNKALQVMLSGLVDYKIAKDSIPPITTSEYEYLWAGNGIFVRASTQFWEAQIQTVSFKTDGLLSTQNYFKWKGKLVPDGFLRTLYGYAMHACGENLEKPVEVLYRLEWRSLQNSYRLVVPKQRRDHSLVSTTDVGNENTPIEIHSHHVMGTYWSKTDDNDHQGKRIYGVIGDFGKEAPMMRLRLSIHGNRMDIPITDVFSGNRIFIDGAYNG